jgi:hypothetical protein
MTGATFFANLIVGKRLELLRKLVPDASVVAMLLNAKNVNAELESHEMEARRGCLGRNSFCYKTPTSRKLIKPLPSYFNSALPHYSSAATRSLPADASR